LIVIIYKRISLADGTLKTKGIKFFLTKEFKPLKSGEGGVNEKIYR